VTDAKCRVDTFISPDDGHSRPKDVEKVINILTILCNNLALFSRSIFFLTFVFIDFNVCISGCVFVCRNWNGICPSRVMYLYALKIVV